MKNNFKKTFFRIIITAILVVIFLLALFIFVVNWVNENEVILKPPIEIKTNQVITVRKRQTQLLKPLVEEYKIEAKEKKKPDFTNPIEKEIYEVFGEEHFDKAMKLLECENKTLNPKAIHINKDGSQDLGIFQINTYWNGFNKSQNNKRYLFDPAINIRIAWRLYQDSGYSFKLWSCSSEN